MVRESDDDCGLPEEEELKKSTGKVTVRVAGRAMGAA